MREIPLAAIRARAYDIWERNHRPDGYEIQFWLLAERELRAEQESRRDAAPEEQVEVPTGIPGRDPAGQSSAKPSSVEAVEG